MQKIINRILLLILIILIALLAYRTLKPENKIAVSAVTTTQQDSNFESKEKIESIVKQYLINNPEVIIESLEQLQKRKTQELDSKVKDYIKDKKTEIENSATSPFMGNDKGDIVIVSFYDYNCSYCKKGDNYLNELKEADKGVKVIFRPFPILGDISTYVAKVALAVYKIAPEKFMAIHQGLIEMQSISKEEVERILTTNGLNFKDVETYMEKPEIKELINKNFDLAMNLRIQGAPAYIINGRIIPGLIELKQWQQIIKDIRSSGKNSPS